MAITITPEEIRELYPTDASDAVIQMVIDLVVCKIGPCLEANYTDCPDTAEYIAKLLVCHFLYMQENDGQVTSKKWADGDSVSIDPYVSGGTGLNASRYGQMLIQWDSSGCVVAAFPNRKQFIVTVGTAGSKDHPYR